jgi:hypothetical protein
MRNPASHLVVIVVGGAIFSMVWIHHQWAVGRATPSINTGIARIEKRLDVAFDRLASVELRIDHINARAVGSGHRRK